MIEVRAMPLKNGHLTGKERAFVKHMARTGDQTYSAEKAGYSMPVVAGSQLMAKTAIHAEVVREYRARMRSEGLPKAYEVHMELMASEKTPPGTRATLIAEMYKQTLGADDEADRLAKPASEMTADELQKAIEVATNKLEQLAMGAKDVTPPKPDLSAFE